MQVLETGLLTVGVVDLTRDQVSVVDWTLDCRCGRLDSLTVKVW